MNRSLRRAYLEAALQLQWQIMLRSGDPLLSPAVALQRLGNLVVTERPRDALVFYQRAAAMLRLMRAQHPANRLLQRDATAVAVAIADAYNTSNEFAPGRRSVSGSAAIRHRVTDWAAVRWAQKPLSCNVCRRYIGSSSTQKHCASRAKRTRIGPSLPSATQAT